MKQTIKQAGYIHLEKLFKGVHLLRNIETGKIEMFAVNKNHAGWCLKYKNTHLEYCRTIQ